MRAVAGPREGARACGLRAAVANRQYNPLRGNPSSVPTHWPACVKFQSAEERQEGLFPHLGKSWFKESRNMSGETDPAPTKATFRRVSRVSEPDDALRWKNVGGIWWTHQYSPGSPDRAGKGPKLSLLWIGGYEEAWLPKLIKAGMSGRATGSPASRLCASDLSLQVCVSIWAMGLIIVAASSDSCED